jgi:predicted ATPase
MLEFIRVRNYKTLLDASFPLSDLNIFSGLNGMGKSSLLQTLLLLRQSHERNTLWSKGLLLKGDLVSLGVGRDVLAANADSGTLGFLVKWRGRPAIQFEFEAETNSDLLARKGAANGSGSESGTDAHSLFSRNFQYLAAERLGPKSYYEMSEYHIRDLNSLGNRGEYAVHFIAENALKNIPSPALKNPRATTLGLLENLDAWMSEISPGIRIKAIAQPSFNAVSLSYSFVQGMDVTSEFLPQHVGFGLTYVLPVLTAILRSRPGDLLIIENPESHLHPAGQSMLGRLCSLAAAQGIQFFIETHSDHFLNGVRVAVKEGRIGAEKVGIFFLERPGARDAHASVIHNPSVDSLGRLDQWPKGFFDEWDKQLGKLL